jgi:hypothetical protein
LPIEATLRRASRPRPRVSLQRLHQHARAARHHAATDPRRSTSNGHVERLQQTILEECWRPSFARSLLPKSTALAKDLDHYLAYDNFDRAHTGRLTNGRIPAEIVYGARKMKATR